MPLRALSPSLRLTLHIDPDNTRTPLIAWGAGIRGPLPDPSNTTHDEFSLPWGTPLTSLYRQDVHQADIAPLMSALIGQDWPANSVGVLPDVGGVGYLDFGEENERRKAEGAFVNAKVILEHYRVKNSKSFDWGTSAPADGENQRRRQITPYHNCISPSQN